MSDRFDEMRISPDPSLAEALRQRLHARMASVALLDHEGRSHLQLDTARLEPERDLIPVQENDVSVDSPIRETRVRRLAVAAAAVVAVIGAVAISINLANSEDDAPTPAVATVAPPTTSTPTTVAIATTTEPVGVPGDFPDGTYRVEVTNSDLDAVNAKNWHLAGTWEWTFHAGDWSYRNSSTSALVESTYSGTYVVDGDHITLFVPGYLWTGEQGPNEFTWHANPDGSVQLGWLATTEPNWAAILASHPLVPTS